MKILYTNLRFSQCTGSELYLYELTREMLDKGHEVSIFSTFGGEVSKRAEKNGVELLDEKDLKGRKFDIMHLAHPNFSRVALEKFPKTPAVMTVHSEVIPKLEFPLEHKNIKYYICIRKSIAKSVNDQGFKNTEVIYNPIDFSRFNKDYPYIPSKNRIILFVGRPDVLRANAIVHLIDSVRFTERSQVWFVGRDFPKYRDIIWKHLPSRVQGKIEFYDETWDVEKYVRKCSITASVLMGRTTLEGWACGKPGFIFDIDSEGVIKDVRTKYPPKNMARFDSRVVADQIEKVYRKAI